MTGEARRVAQRVREHFGQALRDDSERAIILWNEHLDRAARREETLQEQALRNQEACEEGPQDADSNAQEDEDMDDSDVELEDVIESDNDGDLDDIEEEVERRADYAEAQGGFALVDFDESETYQPAGSTLRLVSPIHMWQMGDRDMLEEEPWEWEQRMLYDDEQDHPGYARPWDGRWTYRAHEPESEYAYDMDWDEDEGTEGEDWAGARDNEVFDGGRVY